MHNVICEYEIYRLGGNRMKKISLILFLCIIAFSILGAEDKSVIKLIPVYEKTFQDTIVDVVFDTATVSISEAKAMGWKTSLLSEKERKKGEVKVSYPKTVFISDEFYGDGSAYRTEARIYNENGEIVKMIRTRHHRENFTFSANGEYILLARLPIESEPGWMGGSLYKTDGTQIWEKYDGGFPRTVSSDGYVAALSYPSWEGCPPGDYIIYDSTGQEVAIIKNPYKGLVIGSAIAKFSKDGEYLLVGFTDTHTKSTFILTTKKGEILWSKEYTYDSFHSISEIDIFNKLGIAGIFDEYERSLSNEEVRKYYAFFIDWEGNLKWTVPLEIRGNMIVKISEDKEKVYIVSSIGYLWCIKVNNGEILWTHRESWAPDPLAKGKGWPWEVPRFRKLKIKGDHLYIIGKQGRNWHSSTLFVFDGENGKLLKKVEYPLEKITFAKCKEGIGLINITKRKMYIFKKVQK